MANTVNLISKTTITSSQTSVSITSIPSTYDDLWLIANIRADTGYAFAYDEIGIGYGGGTINKIQMYGGNFTGSSAAGDNRITYGNTGQTSTTNLFGTIQIYIPGYARSYWKQAIITTGINDNTAGVGNVANASAHLIQNTSAISTISFSPWNSTYVALTNSVFKLYGIKNS